MLGRGLLLYLAEEMSEITSSHGAIQPSDVPFSCQHERERCQGALNLIGWRLN